MAARTSHGMALNRRVYVHPTVPNQVDLRIYVDVNGLGWGAIAITASAQVKTCAFAWKSSKSSSVEAEPLAAKLAVAHFVSTKSNESSFTLTTKDWCSRIKRRRGRSNIKEMSVSFSRFSKGQGLTEFRVGLCRAHLLSLSLLIFFLGNTRVLIFVSAKVVLAVLVLAKLWSKFCPVEICVLSFLFSETCVLKFCLGKGGACSFDVGKVAVSLFVLVKFVFSILSCETCVLKFVLAKVVLAFLVLAKVACSILSC